MSTTLTQTDLGTDRWVEFPADWETYTSLLRCRGERGRPRYLFLDGRITIVSPGHSHESLKTRLAALIDEVLVELSIDFHPCGEVTLLGSRHPRMGTEGDATYYLTNLDRVRGKPDLVMGRDPPPDLVVEVVVSHPEDDVLEAYRRFGVREVWVCKEAGLEFLVLGADGSYATSPVSSVLPFLAADELTPWVFRREPASEAQLRRLFRTWVETTLAPRHRPGDDR